MLIAKLLQRALPLALITRPLSKNVFEIAPALFDKRKGNKYYRLVPVSRSEAASLIDQHKVVVVKKVEGVHYGTGIDNLLNDDDYYYSANSSISYDDDDDDDLGFDAIRRQKPAPSKAIKDSDDRAERDENDENDKNDENDDSRNKEDEKALSVNDLAFLEAERRFDRLMAAEEAAFFSGLNEERAAYSSSSSDGNLDSEFETMQERSKILFEEHEKTDESFIKEAWSQSHNTLTSVSSNDYDVGGGACDDGGSDY